ncbi:MAG: hypothetical protein WDN04_10055 [Rhodospirillales bacterium]
MTEPPVEVGYAEINARPRRTGRHWFDLILAVSAIFISVISLYIGVQHGRTERDMVQASSWPFVQAIYTTFSSGSVSLAVFNAGIGPAKLETFQLLYKGAPVRSVHELLANCCAEDKAHGQLIGSWSWDNPNQQVLRPGQTLTVFSFDAKPGAAIPKFAAEPGSLTYRACYCSVFDQCWLGNLVDLQPRSVPSCSPVPNAFNQQSQPGPP